VCVYLAVVLFMWRVSKASPLATNIAEITSTEQRHSQEYHHRVPHSVSVSARENLNADKPRQDKYDTG